MKKSKFKGAQIMKAVKENEAGLSIKGISRELGINKGTFYDWLKKYLGLEINELRKLKALKEESSKLKRMFADQALHLEMAKDVVLEKE